MAGYEGIGEGGPARAGAAAGAGTSAGAKGSASVVAAAGIAAVQRRWQRRQGGYASELWRRRRLGSPHRRQPRGQVDGVRGPSSGVCGRLRRRTRGSMRGARRPLQRQPRLRHAGRVARQLGVAPGGSFLRHGAARRRCRAGLHRRHPAADHSCAILLRQRQHQRQYIPRPRGMVQHPSPRRVRLGASRQPPGAIRRRDGTRRSPRGTHRGAHGHRRAGRAGAGAARLQRRGQRERQRWWRGRHRER
mmetsp:Transcript_32272/g.79686  ORF Transcript_32272/g.79686 Transcript_32272/m.79686 type:complete len:247 (-) Transcript_32272:445-1185(-)